MKLHELSYTKGSKHSKYRKGRGIGSGNGKTAGRGTKGQNSRSGGGVRPGFEGGQNPLFRRIPKFGFTNVNRKDYAIVNVESLNSYKEGTTITITDLVEAKLVRGQYNGVKVLGKGELTVKNLTIKANKFSKSALAAIEKSGGKAEVI